MEKSSSNRDSGGLQRSVNDADANNADVDGAPAERIKPVSSSNDSGCTKTDVAATDVAATDAAASATAIDSVDEMPNEPEIVDIRSERDGWARQLLLLLGSKNVVLDTNTSFLEQYQLHGANQPGAHSTAAQQAVRPTRIPEFIGVQLTSCDPIRRSSGLNRPSRTPGWVHLARTDIPILITLESFPHRICIGNQMASDMFGDALHAKTIFGIFGDVGRITLASNSSLLEKLRGDDIFKVACNRSRRSRRRAPDAMASSSPTSSSSSILNLMDLEPRSQPPGVAVAAMASAQMPMVSIVPEYVYCKIHAVGIRVQRARRGSAETRSSYIGVFIETLDVPQETQSSIVYRCIK